jgi:hypothetical protein
MRLNLLDGLFRRDSHGLVSGGSVLQRMASSGQLIVENDVEQGAVNLQTAVVVDKT